MRIAFLGKGGSGKTTTASAFARFVASKLGFVLAIDADINAHLGEALGFSAAELGNKDLWPASAAISRFLQGTRTDLGVRPMISTTPPTLKSNFVSVNPQDPFLLEYAHFKDHIALLTVGKFQEQDVGSSCFHEMLYTLATVMHHMLDTDNDVVVADTTAGTDNVATSLYFAYDLQIFVVEPSEKSVRVFHDFIALNPLFAERTFVLANKVEGREDQDFIKAHIPNQKIVGMVPFSDNLRRFEQKIDNSLQEFDKQQAAMFEEIFALLVQKKRNWSAYLQQLRQAHITLCQRWYNNFHGMKLETEIDEDFDYERAIKQRQGSPALLSSH